MKIENLDLHGFSVEEALEKTKINLNWCIQHNVACLDINHGKGYHSDRNFSVIKQAVRKYLKAEPLIRSMEYKVIYGESDYPIALTFDEGHTLVVAKGLENQYTGGQTQQQKNRQIFSEEGKKSRKTQKFYNADKRNHK